MANKIKITAICILLLTSFITTTAVSGRSILQPRGEALIRLDDLSTKLVSSYDFDGITIYVDDDNTAGPWNGTQQYPYKNIQDGIDNASNNDTIFVYNGTYNENIQLNKTVKLLGEDKNSTVINGSDIIAPVFAVIVIEAEGTDVSGFTIKNNVHNGIFIERNNCTIHGNIITETNFGIFLIFNEGCFIYNNIISNSSLGVLGTSSHDNFITDNIIDNNSIAGIEIADGKDNNISLNIITNNKYYGIALAGCEGSYIFLNNIENNGHRGISLYDSSNSYIVFNKIENNGKNPDPILIEEIPAGGIYLGNSSNLCVKFNNIQNNSEYGLKASNCSVSCTWNWWGSLLGPSRTELGLLGDRLIVENSIIVDTFPWLPFKNPFAGYNEKWEYDYY